MQPNFRHQWGHIDLHTKSSLKQNIFKLSKEVNCDYLLLNKINNYRFSREETRAFSLMLSQIIVFLIKCEWPQQWPTMLPEFLSLGKIGVCYFLDDSLRFLDSPDQISAEFAFKTV